MSQYILNLRNDNEMSMFANLLVQICMVNIKSMYFIYNLKHSLFSSLHSISNVINSLPLFFQIITNSASESESD